VGGLNFFPKSLGGLGEGVNAFWAKSQRVFTITILGFAYNCFLLKSFSKKFAWLGAFFIPLLLTRGHL
jgi:hypothetical protein